MKALVSKENDNRAYLVGESDLIDSLGKLLTVYEVVIVRSVGITTVSVKDEGIINLIEIIDVDNIYYYLVKSNPFGFTNKEIDKIITDLTI